MESDFVVGGSCDPESTGRRIYVIAVFLRLHIYF